VISEPVQAQPVQAQREDWLSRFFPDGPQTLFQRVVDSARPDIVHGREALMRGPRGLPYEAPVMAFALAKAMGAVADLDRMAATAAIQRHSGGRLFVNLHPMTLVGGDLGFLARAADEAGVPRGHLVLQIVEHEVGGGLGLAAAVSRLRDDGFRLAVDDLGEGAAGLRRVLELRPDYVKIDSWAVQGAAEDRRRRAVLRALGALASDLGALAIAEGVERRADLAEVVAAGIPLAQGYLLGAPEAAAAAPAAGGVTAIAEIVDGLGPTALDALPFGVVQLALDGTILQFNHYEENLSDRRAPHVVGRNFFTEVAPCTNVKEFAGRFRDGVAKGSLHVSFDYRFLLPKRPRDVRVTLYLSPATATAWVFVQERHARAGAPP
jgi:photoactive yellow protein